MLHSTKFVPATYWWTANFSFFWVSGSEQAFDSLKSFNRGLQFKVGYLLKYYVEFVWWLRISKKIQFSFGIWGTIKMQFLEWFSRKNSGGQPPREGNFALAKSPFSIRQGVYSFKRIFACGCCLFLLPSLRRRFASWEMQKKGWNCA